MRNVIPKNAVLIPPQAKRVFEGIIYDVYHWQQKLYDGKDATFEMLGRADTVKVIAIKDNKIVILDQEQPHQKPFCDIPGGMHDNDAESELDAAKRELLEETGLKFKNWRLLDVSQPNIKIEQFVYIFLATELESQTEPKLDAGEIIEMRLLSLGESRALLDDPKNRYLPKEIFLKINSIEELINLPGYSAG